ncbi:Os12g0235650 [Oryza sativa Japonica Group]|uniref:Os12g0235650 protein n=1 Tax=Oryza sativa subsp. japonica TaxID=39947 RepID=A0A0P0Y8L0_ORYSJ|nr:hypothetical protein EE612_058581 [Oryza sativa]BAT16464.1 Os12g0235650 [Oryza sativa Japonica Group]
MTPTRATPAASAMEMRAIRLVLIGWWCSDAAAAAAEADDGVVVVVVVVGAGGDCVGGGTARQGTWRGKPQRPGLLRKEVGPWLASEPVCGMAPERLLKRRSSVTVAGSRPSSGGTTPENRLCDRLSVPASLGSSPRSAGMEPLNPFDEMSSCWRLAISAQIPAGTSPENEFPARMSRCRLRQFRRSPGSPPDSAFLDTSRFCSRGMSQSAAGRAPVSRFP